MITADMMSKKEKTRLKHQLDELKQIEDDLFTLGGYDLD